MLGAATDRTGASARRAATPGSQAAETRIAHTFEPPFTGPHATGRARSPKIAVIKQPGAPEIYPYPVGEPNVWSVAHLPEPDSEAADLSVNGFELSCAVPDGTGAEPPGATPFGLLAASLSACTAMSVRTFLQRWHVDPGAVTVRVGVHPS